MSLVRTRRRTAFRWLYTLGAILALVSQLGLAVASLAEQNGGRSAISHTEDGGARHHLYGHNEANCAACHARSVHSTAAPAPDKVAELPPPHRPINALGVRSLHRIATTKTNPRAPPGLI